MSETTTTLPPQIPFPTREEVDAAWNRLAEMCEEMELQYATDLIVISHGIAGLRARDERLETELERLAACEPAHRARITGILNADPSGGRR